MQRVLEVHVVWAMKNEERIGAGELFQQR